METDENYSGTPNSFTPSLRTPGGTGTTPLPSATGTPTPMEGALTPGAYTPNPDDYTQGYSSSIPWSMSSVTTPSHPPPSSHLSNSGSNNDKLSNAASATQGTESRFASSPGYVLFLKKTACCQYITAPSLQEPLAEVC